MVRCYGFTPPNPLKEQGAMKAKTRVILEMTIEEGVARGWSRAHKHTESPSEQVVKDAIEDFEG